jgi:hypothetical protein
MPSMLSEYDPSALSETSSCFPSSNLENAKVTQDEASLHGGRIIV